MPVGSENLDKKYNLGVSPATIRNEMVALTKAGYLKTTPYFSRTNSHPNCNEILYRSTYGGKTNEFG